MSNACGCSINDLVLATVAGALRGYLAEKGDPIAKAQASIGRNHATE